MDTLLVIFHPSKTGCGPSKRLDDITKQKKGSPRCQRRLHEFARGPAADTILYVHWFLGGASRLKTIQVNWNRRNNHLEETLVWKSIWSRHLKPVVRQQPCAKKKPSNAYPFLSGLLTYGQIPMGWSSRFTIRGIKPSTILLEVGGI